MLQSIVQQRGTLKFPQHVGERVYMREFRKQSGLPTHLKHWQNTVDAMLDGVDTDGPIYLMIDQGVVKAGTTHRRPGVHIDGYWNPATNAWDTSGHGSISTHGGNPGTRIGHSYVPPSEPSGHRAYRSHNSEPPPSGRHNGGGRSHMSGAASWQEADYVTKEGIILASSVTAAKAYNGCFTGKPNDGGDCSHIALDGLSDMILESGSVYAGNVTMLHESATVPHDCLRTVVRLNVPGWSPE